MFIQTETTPNPATVKFVPGQAVMSSGTADFRSAEEAAHSILAARLFQVEDVVGVFLGSDFVSVTKVDDADWQLLKPVVLGIIMEHYVSGLPVIDMPEDVDSLGDQADAGPDSEIIDQIKELLETRVRPAVAQDGGDIEFRGFENGIVMLELRGSCQGCPSATMTLKMGVEKMLKHYIPEVVEVRAIQ